ncbi:hypothetical protein QC334_37020 [Streptomyces sp. DH18]|uniref:hypothetical protein n=1 Tax=Streptomyces sp. DH18 TaxID=3040126 RepID=UPI002441488E|nr:hypothetical protein [Streptomyces sp. DH18]MDG9688267.1 hypothetical protein [Streptomyces sp. DH18]
MPTLRSLDLFPPSLDLTNVLAARSAVLPQNTGAGPLLTSLHAARAATSNLTRLSSTVNTPASAMKNLPPVKAPVLPFPDLMGGRMSKLDSLLPGLSPSDSIAFTKTLVGRSAAASALDTFSRTLAGFNSPMPAKAFGLSTLPKSALFGMAPARLGAKSVIDLGFTSLPRQILRSDLANGPTAALRGSVLAAMPRTRALPWGMPEDWLYPLRSINRLLDRLGAPIVWKARAALDSYQQGDSGPMREFLHDRLRLRPATEDHAQALAFALLLREWENHVDLQDADAVRLALRACAREGNLLDSDHQVMGRSVGHLPVGIDLRSPEPGPEEVAVSAATPWADRFDSQHVRYATKRLKSNEQRVARAWAENSELNWQQAPLLVDMDVEMGSRVRRKLLRAGGEIVRRTEAQILGES